MNDFSILVYVFKLPPSPFQSVNSTPQGSDNSWVDMLSPRNKRLVYVYKP